MTAEIAVMNREAIALAADSAVTVSDGEEAKVFPSVNKIFAISKYEPVAAMVYGNAGLMGVPWEPIVKLYRHQLGRKKFDRVEEYADNLLRFLREHTKLFPEDQGRKFFRGHLAGYFALILGDMIDKPDPTKPGSTKAARTPDAATVKGVIDRHLALWKNTPYLPTASAKEAGPLRTKYRKLIEEVRDHVFKKVLLPNTEKRTLVTIGVFALLKCPKELQWASMAGLGVAGFGEDELFPSLRAFSVYGVFGGHLNYRPGFTIGIGFDIPVCIRPFAQDDAVYTFMEGVDRGYQREIDLSIAHVLASYPKRIIDQCAFLNDATKAKIKGEFDRERPAVVRDYIDNLAKRRREKFWDSVVELVAVLPKIELATLAESMVNLTSLRRRVEVGVETVAGPVDVALISKGDGLIWVKRKHYFDPRLNHQFFANYYPDAQVPR